MSRVNDRDIAISTGDETSSFEVVSNGRFRGIRRLEKSAGAPRTVTHRTTLQLRGGELFDLLDIACLVNETSRLRLTLHYPHCAALCIVCMRQSPRIQPDLSERHLVCQMQAGNQDRLTAFLWWFSQGFAFLLTGTSLPQLQGIRNFILFGDLVPDTGPGER